MYIYFLNSKPNGCQHSVHIFKDLLSQFIMTQYTKWLDIDYRKHLTY